VLEYRPIVFLLQCGCCSRLVIAVDGKMCLSWKSHNQEKEIDKLLLHRRLQLQKRISLQSLLIV
jgi:hypothetical protein